MICETCGYWATIGETLIDGHHPHCPKLAPQDVSDERHRSAHDARPSALFPDADDSYDVDW